MGIHEKDCMCHLCLPGQAEDLKDMKKHIRLQGKIPNSDFLKDMQSIFDTALSIVEKKNQDYAAGNDPFANFRGSEFVGVDYKRGILVRMLDKIKRASNLLTNKPKVVDESIEDTLMDNINYSALLLLAIRYDREGEKCV